MAFGEPHVRSFEDTGRKERTAPHAGPEDGAASFARARDSVRGYTATHPYAALGGALALGCFAGAGAAFSLRVLGLLGAFGLRAVAGLAAEHFASRASRAFDAGSAQGDGGDPYQGF